MPQPRDKSRDKKTSPYSKAEVHPKIVCLPGGYVSSLVPSRTEVMGMLAELRLAYRWPMEFTAAVLGVKLVTLESWMEGRGPSAHAYKLIWLIHSLLLNPGKVLNVWDVATWGRVPCRDSLKKALGPDLTLDFTIFLTDTELVRAIKRIEDPPPAKIQPRKEPDLELGQNTEQALDYMI